MSRMIHSTGTRTKPGMFTRHTPPITHVAAHINALHSLLWPLLTFSAPQPGWTNVDMLTLKVLLPSPYRLRLHFLLSATSSTPGKIIGHWTAASFPTIPAPLLPPFAMARLLGSVTVLICLSILTE